MRKLAIMLLLLSANFVAARAQDVVILGAAGQEGELTYPQGILEGPDGNIYVYDQVDAFIKVYSPQGRFLRKLGGEGQGPGEIQRRDGVSFGFTAEGLLFFTEYFQGHRWITLLKPNGELVRVAKLDLSGFFGVSEARALPDGGFLAEFHFWGEPDKQKDYYLYKSDIRLLRLNAEGAMSAEVMNKNYYSRISPSPDGGDSELPFTPLFNWCLGKNQTILFSDGLSTAIEEYDLGGKLVRLIATELPESEKVRDKDLDRWREEKKRFLREINPDWYNRFGSVIEKYTKSIHKLKPRIAGLQATPEGNILVAGVADEKSGEADYSLLDRTGKTLARVNVRAGIRIS
ncbi:MAG: hypothetical protein AB1715_06495, partial [Acidobacteriota bacterium]